MAGLSALRSQAGSNESGATGRKGIRVHWAGCSEEGAAQEPTPSPACTRLLSVALLDPPSKGQKQPLIGPAAVKLSDIVIFTKIFKAKSDFLQGFPVGTSEMLDSDYVE